MSVPNPPDVDPAAATVAPADRASPAFRPRPLDLDSALLRTFVILAHTRSFTRTASLVSRSQSAVTQQIQKLEEGLEQALFIRTKRQVALTTAGEVLLAYATQILDLLDQASSKLRSPGMQGEVRFGSPEDFATFFLPELLARFLERHPSVVLRTNCELTLNLIEGFNRGHYDAVVIKQEPGRLYPGAQPLWREQLVWVGSAPPLQGAPVQPLPSTALPAPGGRDTGVRLVLSPAPCVYRKHALEALDAAGIPWTVVYTSPSLAGAAAAVKAGLGLSVLPQNMIPDGLLRMPDDQILPRLKETEICLLARPALEQAAGLFAAFIMETLSH
jgi:DNA-binding transcriptional LysR family regulator